MTQPLPTADARRLADRLDEDYPFPATEALARAIAAIDPPAVVRERTTIDVYTSAVNSISHTGNVNVYKDSVTDLVLALAKDPEVSTVFVAGERVYLRPEPTTDGVDYSRLERLTAPAYDARNDDD